MRIALNGTGVYQRPGDTNVRTPNRLHVASYACVRTRCARLCSSDEHSLRTIRSIRASLCEARDSTDERNLATIDLLVITHEKLLILKAGIRQILSIRMLMEPAPLLAPPLGFERKNTL